MRALLPFALAAGIPAQSSPPIPTFAAPVRIEIAGKWLGEGRLYPSPVLHDVDGDGRKDLVIGDLRGHLTVALRRPGEPPTWAAESKLMASDGQLLDFHNW